MEDAIRVHSEVEPANGKELVYEKEEQLITQNN